MPPDVPKRARSFVKDDEKTRRRRNVRAWVLLVVCNILFALVSVPMQLPGWEFPCWDRWFLILVGLLIWFWHPIGVSLALAYFGREMFLEPGRRPLAGLLFSAVSIATWAILSARLFPWWEI